MSEGPDGFAITLDGRQAARRPEAARLATSRGGGRGGGSRVAGAGRDDRALAHARDAHRQHGARQLRGAHRRGAADVAAYAASDLVFYRAGEPEGLVASQNRHWNPIVEWAEAHLGARFTWPRASSTSRKPMQPSPPSAPPSAAGASGQPCGAPCLHHAHRLLPDRPDGRGGRTLRRGGLGGFDRRRSLETPRSGAGTRRQSVAWRPGGRSFWRPMRWFGRWHRLCACFEAVAAAKAPQHEVLEIGSAPRSSS